VCARDRLFITKIEMATRCRGVGGEEVGVKCGCMQGVVRVQVRCEILAGHGAGSDDYEDCSDKQTHKYRQN